jgi:IS5 family transposase
MSSEHNDDEKSKMRKRITKRDTFLTIMDNIIPWDEWVACIEPYYPTGERGRPPMGVEVMLRMYLLQCWFYLSDEGMEDAIYDSLSMQSFMK